MKQFCQCFFFLLFVALFTTNASSQESIKTYSAEWKNVEGFVKKNLPQSALAEVKKIYALAKKEKQDAQVIKALLSMAALQTETVENNQVLSIRDFEKEIAVSKEPVASILNSLVAEQYLALFRQNRYRLYNRTATVDFNKDDPNTWSADDFHSKISKLYLKSIANSKLLQQTSLPPFDAIIDKGNMRHLRPTLFDLLAQRALLYFKDDERDITKPAYAFEINEASAFDPASDFIHRKFITNDTASLHHKALLLYQQLIAFHSNDAKPDALIDADLSRLEFVRSKSTRPDKDQLYFNSVNHIAHQYEGIPAAAQAWYLVAAYYNEQSNLYKPLGDTAHRYDRVKAAQICEMIVAQKDSSEGRVNCYNLLHHLQAPALSLQVEKVNVPAQPFRALVSFTNTTSLHLKLVKADENLLKLWDKRDQDELWPALIKTNALRRWQQQLPDTKDLQEHRSEIKIDALPSGEYILLAGDNENYDNQKTLLVGQLIYVSAISFTNYGDDYFILDRDNGQPLIGATVQVMRNTWDYKQQKYRAVKAGNFTTDAKGFFHLTKKFDEDRNFAYTFDIRYKEDRLHMRNVVTDYNYRDDGIAKVTTTVYLFGDRSIYRPGQTLYFKGIAISHSNKFAKAHAVEDLSTTLYLRNANYQVIDSMKVKTNDYGSFSGKFQLPETGLTGNYSLFTKDNNGNISFRVEEYKRPKFSVDYEPLKETYRVNDKITVTGFAKAYAGNNIDGAIVKYRVVRQPRFIYYWMFSRYWQPPVTSMEVAHGELKTDKDGKFKVVFDAIPDLSIDSATNPLFDYRIYADVTDINGETRSAERVVSVGYRSLQILTEIPSRISIDSLHSLSIRTENTNHVFQPAKVTVSITQLQPESRLIRARLWEQPDEHVMSKSEYISNFPYDEYANETDPATWPRRDKLIEKTDSVREGKRFNISNKGLEPGYYEIAVTTRDKDGGEVKDIRRVQLYDENDTRSSGNDYLFTSASETAEPGGKARFQVEAAATNVNMIQQVLRSKDTAYTSLQLSDSRKNIEFTATEADRGGFGVNWMFIKNNRLYHNERTVSVPWTNKELAIEYLSYRDKTLPGSEEKWKVKISGYKNEKLMAEMLASMYDASLDQFYAHAWNKPYLWSMFYNAENWNADNNFSAEDADRRYTDWFAEKYLDKRYDQLIGMSIGGGDNDGGYFYNAAPRALMGRAAGVQVERSANADLEQIVVVGYGMGKKTSVMYKADSAEYEPGETDKADEKNPATSNDAVQVRSNFNETAFFFPDLHTDSTGSIEFSFTLPDALTKWKFQALAHTKSASFGYSSKEIITQKQLMVQPNAPRFLREGDKMEFSAKVVNMTEKEFTGTAEFQLFDAATNEPVDGRFQNSVPNQYFTVAAGQSEVVKFPIEVPFQFNKALRWCIVAKANEFSDGEENMMPVLTNRELVTETITLPMNGSGQKNFTFNKLLQSGQSETLQHYGLTIEYTSNPAWYAVQALPYLMEYPYECAEQTWNRYYANTLAGFIANASPRIKQVFEKWRTIDTAALLSNLQKNQELKSLLLEETPWVLEAKSESEQKKNIALLFDLVKMNTQLNGSYEKLKQMQSPNGGFVWFKGGPDDRYITQYIVTSIGHLMQLKSVQANQLIKLNAIVTSALPYLDKKIADDYNNLIKDKIDLKKYSPGYSVVQYLYMRSFFTSQKIPAATQTAYNYFKGRLPSTWTQQNKYMQGMVALVLSRSGDKTTPMAILKSLKETSIINEELGRYWKDAARSWWWYEAPIERQSLLIEAFGEIANDTKTVDELRTWLLKNKQTNKWESTKATAEACYALLLQGSNWLAAQPAVTIKLGDKTVNTNDGDVEAGSGYFKSVIPGNQVLSTMGNISVDVSAADGAKNTPSSWGAVYWQYFEDYDKITGAATPLQLVKKLFVEKNTDRGPVLTPVNEGDQLAIGDKIKVRIELRVDRDMEYVHMKDLRASAMEPVNVLSSYKWQGGLGYYESTRDASTNFFFSQLRKGTYVFEYPLFITHAGNFSNGITTIQCMYAPEFTAHSEGIRVNVKN